jgi:hypothetical protein
MAPVDYFARTPRDAVTLPLDELISNSLDVSAVSDVSRVDVRDACEGSSMDRAIDIDALAELAIPSGPRDSGSQSTLPPTVVSAPNTPSVSAPVPTTEPQVEDDPFDYGTDAVPSSAELDAIFAELDRLTIQAERATEARKRAEEQLQKAKQIEEQLLTKQIPELLSKMHLDEVVTTSGIQVKVKREIKASLPGHDRIEARMAALRWLINNNHGGVIKNNVTVSLDRGADDRADALVVELRAKGFDVEAKKDVNHMTLGALVRELMAEGKVIPPGTFNLFDMRLAKLTRK